MLDACCITQLLLTLSCGRSGKTVRQVLKQQSSTALHCWDDVLFVCGCLFTPYVVLCVLPRQFFCHLSTRQFSNSVAKCRGGHIDFLKSNSFLRSPAMDIMSIQRFVNDSWTEMLTNSNKSFKSSCYSIVLIHLIEHCVCAFGVILVGRPLLWKVAIVPNLLHLNIICLTVA